jgi:hypothetical protein
MEEPRPNSISYSPVFLTFITVSESFNRVLILLCWLSHRVRRLINTAIQHSEAEKICIGMDRRSSEQKKSAQLLKKAVPEQQITVRAQKISSPVQKKVIPIHSFYFPIHIL